MRTLITTEDGSHSIYVPELNEHYHSTFGAIQESNHVFIEYGLKEILKSKTSIRVFEMGLGTGLNVFLTLLYAIDHPIAIRYTAIEAYPLEPEILKRLNYIKMIKKGTLENDFVTIHSSPWEEWNRLYEKFFFKKHQTSLLDYQSIEKFDLVYFDAFAPDVQPELWTREVFEKIFDSMDYDGILVTYCCKGEVKRNLKSVGFSLEKLPGPPGKREILRARKNQVKTI